MSDDRYRFQSWYVKGYRWLRWRPLHYCIACYRLARWAVGGCQPAVWPPHDETDREYRMTRMRTAEHLWIMTMSTADMRMGRLLTLDEFIAGLRTDAPNPGATDAN